MAKAPRLGPVGLTLIIATVILILGPFMRFQNRLLLALVLFTALVLASPLASRLLPLDAAPKTAPEAAAGTTSDPVIGATGAGLSENPGTSPDLESASVEDLIAATRDRDWEER